MTRRDPSSKPRRGRGPRRSPLGFFATLALAALAVVWAAPMVAWGWHPALAYAAAVSVVTFLLYGYDKGAARGGVTRVPERLLHLFMFAGGTPGALLGQELFRHKTVKRSFRVWFHTLLVVQIVLLCAVLWWRLRADR